MTRVTLAGTGVPHVSPGRAGSGTLVRSGAVALQFDAGRGTVLRLAEAGVTHLVLTHLIPAPVTPEGEAAFEADVRAGGYTGQVTVGRDLTTVAVGDD